VFRPPHLLEENPTSASVTIAILPVVLPLMTTHYLFSEVRLVLGWNGGLLERDKTVELRFNGELCELVLQRRVDVITIYYVVLTQTQVL
jgi:hypothetical protein